MTVLGIDTATSLCGAAIVSGGKVLASKAAGTTQAHAEMLLSVIDSCFAAAGAPGLRPDAVAVASGPGSFTGLRIGFSSAKGICFARGSALVAVPTFEAWLFAALRDGRVSAGQPVLAVMSAGRDDAYAGIFRRTEAGTIVDRAPAVHPTDGLPALAASAGDVPIITDDPARAAAWFPGAAPGRIIAPGDGNPAVAVALLGEMMALAGGTADLRFAEPAYVKDFSYTVKKGKGA